MFAVLLLTLAATPELPFDRPGPLVVAPGETFHITSAVAQPILTSLVVWVAQGRMGIERPSIYASRVQHGGNLDDPEGLLVSELFGRDPAVAWVPVMDAWVVAWEWNGQVLLRVIRDDGSFHPATVPPLNLGQGRAPGIAPYGGGYFVTTEAMTPIAQLMSPPASRTLAGPLSLTRLPYATPVRAADITGSSAPMMQASWVEGTTLVSSQVTVMGTLSATPSSHFTSPVRLDLDALASRNDLAFAAYRISDGGSASLEVMRLDRSNRIAIDAGTDVTFATMTPLSNGAFALTSTHDDGRGRAWHVFTDGGFTGLGTVVNGASRVSVASFDLPQSTLLLWSTAHDGVMAQPANLSLAPTQQPVQLSLSPASDRYAQVASWSGGAVAAWQRLTEFEAQTVVWRVFPDGGHAPVFDFTATAARLDVPSVTSLAGGVALLTNQRLRRMDSAGTWDVAVTIPRPLMSASLTTDRAGRLVVIGAQQVALDEEAWVLRYEPDGGVTERLVFPQVSSKPRRPRLAISRDGGAALAIINPAEEIWATRLSSDLVAQDDGGFRVSGISAVDPFVVSDEGGGFIIVYTTSNTISARRVFDRSVGPATPLVLGEWDVGSVIEVPGGAAVVATSRRTAELATVYLTVDAAGLLSSSAQTIVSGGSPTNGAGLAVGQDSLMWVFGRYDADAGAATTRSVVESRAIGAACEWGWQCLSGFCMAGSCRPVPPPDGGVARPDAGVPDAGAALPDAGAAVDGGVPPDAGVGVVDGGAAAADSGVDAGESDSGVVDAGEVDAGVVDAGVADAGVADAGVADAGVADAGVADAGVAASDAGPRSGGSYRAGCDCQSGSGPWLISVLLVLVSARRRRL